MAPVGSTLLSAWLGASALFATVVAPAAFAVLPSRALAGAVVGRVLPTLFVTGMVVAVVAIVLDRAHVGIWRRVRRGALVAVAVACGAAQFVVAPRIEQVRRQIDGPIEQLAESDPRRAAFGRLHAISVAWLGLAMLGAATSIVLASIAPRSGTSAPAKPASALAR